VWYHARVNPEAPTPALLQQYLGEHDEPCPGCGYNLRGLTSSACPECNSELTLSVGLVEPRLGAYITGLVGWSMGAGLNGLLFVYMLVVLSRYGTRGVDLAGFLLYNSLAGAVLGGGLAAWILRLGPRVRRADTRWKWPLASTGWVASLLDVVLLVAFVE
jgi:hypothetical protein